MEREELLRVEWRETASEMEAGGRTVSAGTGAQHRRRSAGYSSTLPFFLHSNTKARNETVTRPPSPPHSLTDCSPELPATTELEEPAFSSSLMRFSDVGKGVCNAPALALSSVVCVCSAPLDLVTIQVSIITNEWRNGGGGPGPSVGTG
ncbi:hypothetical protein AMECASPLE_009176 [Ameca splendens]|uniref:Uncharacterized protein n=1 Tax=Ameca splendens TaxID=208324 RepID=A0ABV0YZK3_9TELE